MDVSKKNSYDKHSRDLPPLDFGDKSCENSILSSKKDVAPVNSSKSKNSADEVSRGTIVLPYVRGISENISRVLRSNNLQVAHRPISKMGDLFPRPKDVKDLSYKTGVVYKIKCSHCNFVYYRQTERSVRTRKAEHRRAICNNLPASKVAQHANNTGHDFDSDSMEVVDTEKNGHQRIFLEAWHSSQYSNSGNDYRQEKMRFVLVCLAHGMVEMQVKNGIRKRLHCTRENKWGLQLAIANARATEWSSRVLRAAKTNRIRSLRGDVENPHRKAQRARKLQQLHEEVTASFRGNKYPAVVERKLWRRQRGLRNIGHRFRKPHSHGLVRSLKETLARAIAREGPDILDHLRPHTDYILFMFPDWAYTRKGADIFREVIDGPFSLRPLELGPDVTDEGSIYWVSCENEDLRVSLVSAGAVVSLLAPDNSYQLFTVVGKSTKEPLDPIFEEAAISTQKVTGKLIVHGAKVSLGALNGIDMQMWEVGREYLVFIRYELRPLPEERDDPGPMRTPEYGQFVNCFVRCVVDHFRNRMTKVADPSKVQGVHGLDLESERALSLISRSMRDKRTPAAWKTLAQKTREVLITFAARAIPSSIQVWLCGDSLMGSDGSLWRTKAASLAIDNAFKLETGYIPDNDLPETLEGKYHKATHSMGGALTCRFRKWTEREWIKPTPEEFRPSWKASQMEARVWNSSDPAAGKSDHHHLDMRAAYLSCEVSSMGDVGDAIGLIREYGFPTSAFRRANAEGVPVCDILTFTGIVQLAFCFSYAPIHRGSRRGASARE
ncbi:hypothetical protein QZH41_011399 [Actinostola sp. cb2023]|nr:hypothetical protein QZH41_011399 [Actinostola sp. cb2023]